MSIDMTSRQNLFNETKGFSPDRNFFDLSHRNISAFDMGILYPVSCFEVVPNDKINLKAQFKLRFNALLANPYSNIKVKFRSFFVPYRIMWKKWRNFITGGSTGTYVVPLPQFIVDNATANDPLQNSLVDYLGLPIDIPDATQYSVNAFPFVAYDFIYYWYFINQHIQTNIVYNIQDELGNNEYPYLNDNFYVDKSGVDTYYRLRQDNFTSDLNFLYNVNWERDYFTSAFKSQQLGQPVAIPVSTTLIDNNSPSDTQQIGYGLWRFTGTNTSINTMPAIDSTTGNVYFTDQQLLQLQQAGVQIPSADQKIGLFTGAGSEENGTLQDFIKNISVQAGTFSVNDLRLAFATQIFQEGLLLGGYEYNDFLNYFFGKSPSNLELQKPYFIGGFNSTVYADDVFQTSQSNDTSSLGDFGGIAVSIDNGDIGEYEVEEYGLIMTLMYIVPSDISQASQGINKMWNRKDKYDYYNPAFANLGEQPIYNSELYIQPTSTGLSAEDNQIFGFQGNYNEYRYIPDYVTSNMRNSLSYFHLARIYENRPALNEEYIKCQPSKRIFAVQRTDTPNITGIINMQVYAYRPMPALPIPGLLDHRY